MLIFGKHFKDARLKLLHTQKCLHGSAEHAKAKRWTLWMTGKVRELLSYMNSRHKERSFQWTKLWCSKEPGGLAPFTPHFRAIWRGGNVCQHWKVCQQILNSWKRWVRKKQVFLRKSQGWNHLPFCQFFQVSNLQKGKGSPCVMGGRCECLKPELLTAKGLSVKSLIRMQIKSKIQFLNHTKHMKNALNSHCLPDRHDYI